MENQKIEVVVVSGLSGAGKTVALRALEDIGYFCIDNLPLTLIDPFLSTIKTGERIKKIGIGVDIREKFFLSDAYRIFSELKSRYRIEILFLEAEKEVMVRRYKETRRPHPMLSSSGGTDMETAIEEERSCLMVIRDAADRIIDTSNYTPHQLRHIIVSAYGRSDAARQGLGVTLISFGYKFGTPHEVDLMFDVRFLPNPYFVQELKALKGTDREVSGFVMEREETKAFLDRVHSLLDFLIPQFIAEGRAYLVVGIGCTGGRHRSPAVIQALSEHIKRTHGITPGIIHRDIDL